MEMADALHRYCDGLFRFREVSERVGERRIPGNDQAVHLRESAELGIQFGIVSELEKALQGHSTDSVLMAIRRIADVHESNRNFLGPDGVVVIPGESWYVGTTNLRSTDEDEELAAFN